MSESTKGGPAAGWRGLLAQREYVGLLGGLGVSLLGDQLAAVALTVLVFAVTAVGAPAAAARQPVMREVLADDAGYQRGSGLDEMLQQVGQVGGFVTGGLLLTVLSPGTALLGDAASFLGSALLLRLTLRDRPAPEPVTTGGEAGAPLAAPAELRGLRAAVGARLSRARLRAAELVRGGDARAGWRAALGPGCRLPLLLTWGGLSCTIAPEALATPWAHSLGAGPVGVGLLFAAVPAGMIVGLVPAARVSPERGERLLVPLALGSLLPLLAAALRPPITAVLLLLVVSGAAQSYNLLARTAFVRHVDPAARGRAFSIAAAGLMTGQGLGIAAAGVLASTLGPAPAVAALAAVGLAWVSLAAFGSLPIRATSRRDAPQDLLIDLTAATPTPLVGSRQT